MNERTMRIIKNIVFNLSEIYFISIIGFSLQVELKYILMMFLLFFLSRFHFKNPKHYKKWYLCSIWSTSLFLTLFILLKQDIAVSLLAAIFAAYVASGAADLNDMFMFKAKGETNYKELDLFILYQFDDPRLMRLEDHLKRTNTFYYNIYELRFKRNATWKEINSIHDLGDKKLQEILDQIYMIFAFNLNLTPLEIIKQQRQND